MTGASHSGGNYVPAEILRKLLVLSRVISTCEQGVITGHVNRYRSVDEDFSILVSFLPVSNQSQVQRRCKCGYDVIEALQANDLNELPIAEMLPGFFKVISCKF
jgi:hypothetical protein